ncbi:MAG: PDZ domain-containing protein [Armatimonadetes bacterium]|nr:PDZ domain-containing protein [Armatimonadota bacterium]
MRNLAILLILLASLPVSAEAPPGGVGIVLPENKTRAENLRVMEVIKGLPAHRAGIMPGDEITAVDGVSTRDRSLEQAKNLIIGPVGTPVTLTLLRGGRSLIARLLRISILANMQLPVLVINPMKSTAKVSAQWVDTRRRAATYQERYTTTLVVPPGKKGWFLWDGTPSEKGKSFPFPKGRPAEAMERDNLAVNGETVNIGKTAKLRRKSDGACYWELTVTPPSPPR